jgi:class 3 adenylate cyclase
MTEVAGQALEDAREAFERHSWRAAYDGFLQADAAVPLAAEDLERLGEAAWWTGRLADVIAAVERAYSGYLAAGHRADAARAALRLAAEVGHKQEHAASTAWLRRAERLLTGEPESRAQAELSRAHFNRAVKRSEFDAALEDARHTYAIAERLGDVDLMAMGLHDQGQVLVARGEVDEGMALIDEATLAAVNGELGAYATAVVYCNTINACRDLADYGRAGEWTDAAKRWCERQAIAGFPGMCRVRRAEIVRLRGGWSEAEQQARLATSELSEFYLDYAAEGFYQLGEIRLRVGDLEAAEQYFRQAREMGRDPQPGLALLRLAEGRAEAGAAMLRRALEDESSADRLGRARLLPAQVEVAVAVGDLETAQRAAAELESIAETFGSRALVASAAWAQGVRLLAGGDHRSAITRASRAHKLWQEVDVPYELARSRVLLGTALSAAGEDEPATIELEAALAIFERLGAEPDATATRRLLRPGEAHVQSLQHVQTTFMFTDVVGSTQLIEAIGDEAWENLLRWHDDTLRRVIGEHGGDVVKHTGDGFLVVFAAVDAALAAAQAIQRALAEHRREHGFAPQVRVGVHAASGLRHGRDFSGAGVHAAARIAALAGEGEILASSETLDGATHRYVVSNRRSLKLKGISRDVVVATVDWHQ